MMQFWYRNFLCYGRLSMARFARPITWLRKWTWWANSHIKVLTQKIVCRMLRWAATGCTIHFLWRRLLWEMSSTIQNISFLHDLLIDIVFYCKKSPFFEQNQLCRIQITDSIHLEFRHHMSSGVHDTVIAEGKWGGAHPFVTSFSVAILAQEG